MSNGMNKVILLGNLGSDPELRHFDGGRAKLKLRLATTNVWFDKDNNKNERTEWHNVALWGNRAEALHRILTKGQKVMVEGRLETHSYEDAQGNTKYFTEVKARDIILAGGSRRRITEVPLPDVPDVMEAGRKAAPAVANA